MSEEKKKEMIELITPQKTDKDYEEEIERLNNIIKEVREKIRYWQQDYMETYISTDELDDILEILDKGEQK